MTRPRRVPHVPRPAGLRRACALRGVVAGAGALAVLAGAGMAAATSAPRTAPPPGAPLTVRVDPVGCRTPSVEPGVRVVCTPRDVPTSLIDGSTVVVSRGTHRGPLDLRGRSGITVRGLPGAVLDAGAGRYALSLRDTSATTVEGLTLRGGSAQAVWVERTSGVVLRGLVVRGGTGAGLQVRDSRGFALLDTQVRGAAAAGVMELTGVSDSTYRRLVIAGNGRGPAEYNGDGLQLAGERVTVADVTVTGNGSSTRYEHGVYVSSAARSVRLDRVTAAGNAGVAVKLGGSGTLAASALSDDRVALYCGTTSGPGWTVTATTLSAPRPQVTEPSCGVRAR